MGVIKSEEEGKEYFSIRGKGGQALVPPSVHPESGRRYEINNNRPIAEVSLFQLEKVLNEWWKGKPRDIKRILRGVEEGEETMHVFPLQYFSEWRDVAERKLWKGARNGICGTARHSTSTN